MSDTEMGSMKEQANEQQLDVIRVTGLRVRQTGSDGFEHRGMDLQGYGIFGPIELHEYSSVAFAIAASMLVTGVPVYYSNKLHAISTDATFGTTPSMVPDFSVTGPLPVMHIDGIWMLATNKGQLVLTLEGGPVVQFPIDDANAFIGWLHMTEIDMVTLHDGVLALVAPREWEPGSLVY